MKVITATFVALLCFNASYAQTGAAKSAIVCKTLKDSASYALGYNVGQNLSQRYGDMDVNMIIAAIKDAYAKKNGAVDPNAGQNVVQNFLEKENKKKVTLNKAAGQKFWNENAKKPGVITTASGLQYQVIQMGTGEKPTPSDRVKVNYKGTLINGKEFDNSSRHGGSVEFSVGGVVVGWTEALQLMPVGSKFKLFIPANLAYGDSEMGPDIPPGSLLIFDLELLQIVK